MGELPSEETMPRVPEPMEKPQSLGGLADRAGVEVTEEELGLDQIPEVDIEGQGQPEPTMASLIERTEEWSEDIAEKEAAIPSAEDDSEVESVDSVDALEVEGSVEQELE